MTTNASVSSQVVELLKQMDDQPFAARQLLEKIGVDPEHQGAISGSLSHLRKMGILGSEISHEWRGYKWWIADRQKLNDYEYKIAPGAGGDGSRPSKVKKLILSEKPVRPLHERLWDLAIELSEATPDLSSVPIEALVAELSRRMPK